MLNRPFLEAQRSYTQDPSTSKFHMHTHDTYEIYCFLSGNAAYFVEGNTYPLKPGDILIMKKAEAHSLLINSHNPYERIVVNFNADAIAEAVRPGTVDFLDSRPFGIHNRYAASYFPETNWLYYLKKMCETDDPGEKSVYLTVLLCELKENASALQDQAVTGGGIMDIVKYINDHIAENLNLDLICSRFFISKSHINRKFKTVIGTTVWEYITTKRLLLAKEFLQAGVPPTKVYGQCGFQDYCTFFRAFKARFGASPKNSAAKRRKVVDPDFLTD